MQENMFYREGHYKNIIEEIEGMMKNIYEKDMSVSFGCQAFYQYRRTRGNKNIY